jgi:hypothetical protein
MFVDIAEGFTITTFFEAQKTRISSIAYRSEAHRIVLTCPRGYYVIDEGSARLYKAKEHPIGLDAVHLEICKFKDTKHPNYIEVL